jgi:hypothetical protein
MSYSISAFVGGTSEQIRGAEPDVNANDKNIARTDMPVAVERPRVPTPNEFYFDKNKTPMTPVWWDGKANWRDYNNAVVTSPDCSISSFKFTKAANPALAADIVGLISGLSISVTVPALTAVTALKATFIASLLSTVEVGVNAQVSGVTANNFSSPVTYDVTAEDSSTKAFVVTVTVL